MTKITSRPQPTGSKTHESPAHAPAKAPEPSKPAAKAKEGWGAGASGTSAAERREKATGVSTAVANLSDAEKAAVVQKKAVCPFVGSAVAQGALPVRNTADAPLASIDDVVKLGNTGKGSDLGTVLKLFSTGNHGFMAGLSGKLDKPVPDGMLSLDLAGSQGSHPGHSGILNGDPKAANSGKFDEAQFNRLMKYAKNGHIRRSDLGKFIAENVAADPNAKAPGLKAGLAIAKDFGEVVGAVAKNIQDKAAGRPVDAAQERRVTEKLTKLLGEDNLIGAAGEYGLMATLLSNSPKTTQVRAGLHEEPAYSVDDLTLMFKEKKLPEGWESWKKTSVDWAANTTALTLAAEKETILQKFR